MARAAVEAGCHFSDLGGNTEIVFEQKKLHEQALATRRVGHPRLRPRAGHGQYPGRRGDPPARPGGAGEGLRRRPAPAARAAAQLPDRLLARRRARLLHHAVLGAPRRQAGAGGRAERARGRWSSPSRSARSRRSTPAAASARCPFAYQGKIDVMEYKTLRYPGHVAIMRPIRELGLLDNKPVEVKGKSGGAARRLHRRGAPQAAQAAGPGPGGAAGDRDRAEGRQAGAGLVPAHRPLRRRRTASAR